MTPSRQFHDYKAPIPDFPCRAFFCHKLKPPEQSGGFFTLTQWRETHKGVTFESAIVRYTLHVFSLDTALDSKTPGNRGSLWRSISTCYWEGPKTRTGDDTEA